MLGNKGKVIFRCPAFRAACLCLLGLLGQRWGPALSAAPIVLSKEGTVVVRADEAVEDDAERAMHLRGQVHVQAPTWEISAAEATLYGNPADPDRVVADGAPARMRVFRATGEIKLEAEGRHVEYRRADDIVDIEGDAMLTDSRGTIRGDSMRYAIEAQRVTTGAGKRVQGLITPDP